MENYALSALLTYSNFSSECTLHQILPPEPSTKLRHSCVPDGAGKAVASRGVVAAIFKAAAVTRQAALRTLNILLRLEHWKQLTKYFCYAKCLVTGHKMRVRNTACVCACK